MGKTFTLGLYPNIGISSSGTPTTNYLPKFASATTIGNSIISENSNEISLNVAFPTLIFNGSRDYALQSNDTSGSFRIIDNTAGLERLTITSAGNVGIGTSSPGARLAIQGASGADGFGFFMGGAGSTLGGIKVGNDGSTYGSLYFDNATNDVLLLQQYSSGSLRFGTNSAERMRITSGGLVGIANSGINACRLAVTYGGSGSIAVGIAIQDVDNANNAQYMQFLNAATTAIGSISRNGGFNQINYNTTSDYRLKEDFKDFNGIEKVTSIKVYDHKWVGFEGRSNGVIAHELAEVLPYAVTGEKDAIDENGNMKLQQVDYSKIVPIIIKAFQEQNQIIEDLKSRLDKAGL